MHIRFLTVPYNADGIEEYNNGIENSNNMCTLELPEEEFEILRECFGILNKECGLLIDDYESEMIAGEAAIRCKEIIDSLRIQVPVFYKAVDVAIRHAGVIFMDF